MVLGSSIDVARDRVFTTVRNVIDNGGDVGCAQSRWVGVDDGVFVW